MEGLVSDEKVKCIPHPSLVANPNTRQLDRVTGRISIQNTSLCIDVLATVFSIGISIHDDQLQGGVSKTPGHHHTLLQHPRFRKHSPIQPISSFSYPSTCLSGPLLVRPWIGFSSCSSCCCCDDWSSESNTVQLFTSTAYRPIQPYIFRKLVTRTIQWRPRDDNDKDTQRQRQRQNFQEESLPVYISLGTLFVYICYS